jgi:hypothetical protein
MQRGAISSESSSCHSDKDTAFLAKAPKRAGGKNVEHGKNRKKRIRTEKETI